MKRSGFKQPSLEEVRAKNTLAGLKSPRTALKRGKVLGQGQRASGLAGPKQAKVGCARARLKTIPDPELAEWGRKVKKRDGNRCRWPGVSFETMRADFTINTSLMKGPCATGDTRIDPHHIAPRGRRRDLAYVLSNGICLCRTHHTWCHDNPAAAESLGLLSSRTRELASKEGTLGVY